MESSNFSKEFHVAPSSAVTRSGRPKDNAKRGAIIAAAKNLFGRQAFELVTMEAVAAQAAVSKMTVYSHFRDKETLFETIVSTTADEMIGALSAPECGNDLRQRLTALGLAFLGVILGSDVCAMAHTLPGTLRSNRALAVRFYAAGPGRVRSALAAIISAAAERGELTDRRRGPGGGRSGQSCGRAICRRRSPSDWPILARRRRSGAGLTGNGGLPAGLSEVGKRGALPRPHQGRTALGTPH